MGKVNRGYRNDGEKPSRDDNNILGAKDKKEPISLEKELSRLKEEGRLLNDDIKQSEVALRKNSQYVTVEEKTDLRKKCNQLYRIVNKILDIATDRDTIEAYKKIREYVAGKAKKYGSSMFAGEPTKTMDEIKGLDDVKDLVKSFVYMIKNEEAVKYYNIKGGFNMLLYGAPGTGKSMFAEAVASELKLPIFIVKPSDLFKPIVGESEASARALFAEIDACEDGAVLFIDECESIFGKRTGNDDNKKGGVTTELLQAMDGFGVDRKNLIMMAATNCPEQLDQAYLRHKRFSHIVHVSPPDDKAIEALVRSKLRHPKLLDNNDEIDPKKKPIELKGITIDEIVEMIKNARGQKDEDGIYEYYYTPADIHGIIEEACRMALFEMQKQEPGMPPKPVTREMFEKALKSKNPTVDRDYYKFLEGFKAKDRNTRRTKSLFGDGFLD